MKIIFQIEGGIGKNVAATAVCKAIKKKYPDDELIVLTGYPEVFLCNPNVNKALNINDLSYFYQDNIANQKIKVLLHNPYFATDFLNGNIHLIQVWCEMFGLKYEGELPELFINEREKAFYTNQFGSQKPIMVMQTNGGGANQPNKYSWVRDIPISTAQKVVNAFAHEYNIVHIRREDQLPLAGTTPLQANFRAISVLLTISEKRILIDSFAQHAAAALSKPSVVCWIGNATAQFGYEMHTNIVADRPTIKPELRHSVYTKYNITGQVTEFPYSSEAEVFNADRIIDTIMNDSDEGKSNAVKNIKVHDRIILEKKRGSMVANRLLSLTDCQIDLSSVNRILDIGSWHLGQSIEFSNIFRNAKVDAFEPVPDSYHICLENLNKLDPSQKSNIRVHNIALGNAKGIIPFYFVDPNVNQSIDKGFSSMFKFNDEIKTLLAGHNKIQHEIQVQADTLDDWCSENKIADVDIIWMDAQGSELFVFQGAKEILKNTKIIMTEACITPYYQGQTLKSDIDSYLAEFGFIEMKEALSVNTIGDKGVIYEVNTIYYKQPN